MKCVKCGNDIPDKANFCPYCGMKNEQKQEAPVNEPQKEAVVNEPQKEALVNEPKQEAPKNEQTSGQQWSAPLQNKTDNMDGGLILKIGTVILAAIYAFFALRYVFNGVRNVWSCISWGYFGYFPSSILTIVSGVCFASIAVVLVLVGFSKQRDKAKVLFKVLGILGIVVIALSVINMILTLIMGYYFSYAIMSVVKSLIGTVLMLAATYGMMYLTKEAPTAQDFKNVDSMSDLFKDCADAVEGAAKGVASDINSKAGEYRDKNAGSQVPSYSNGVPLKTDRRLLVYILLTLITCGIYGCYFIYALARDVNIACEGDGKTTGGLLKYVLLSLITCGIYAWVWQYSLGNRLASNAPRYGMNFQENGTTILMWNIVGILLCGIGPFIALHILIKNTNSICMAYNREKGLI